MTRRTVTISLLAIAALVPAACSDDDTTPGPTPTAAAGSGGTAGGGGTAGSGGATGGGGVGGDAGSGGAPPVECPDVGLDPSAGTIYYACDCGSDADADCQPGDDTAAGTSPDSPWQTYAQARAEFANLAAGDSIAFCQGGAFTIDGSTGNRWVNEQCQASDRCVVRDYPPPWASGDEGRPIFHVAAGERAFALEDAANANHEEGYIFLNLDLRGAGTGRGFFIYNDVDDVLICNASIDGFDIAVHAAGSNPPDPGSDGLNERIELRLSQITNNQGQGWLGGCNGCAVEYCSFENNGFEQSILNHNIYFSGSSGGVAHDMRAVGNDLYRSAVVSTECEGVSLVVHGEHDGLLIEGNTVREDVGAASPGCWGIAVDTGYGSAEGFRNVTIRGNTVVNVGNVAIGTNACENCLIENNVVIHEQAFGVTAIAVPNRPRSGDDLAMTGVTIRNNSIYIGADGSGRGIRLGDEGTGHVLVSNAVQYQGSNNGWSCFDLDLPTASYGAVDHNLCFFPNATNGQWVAGAGALTAWQSASGFDGSSTVADPAFAAITGPGYDLAPASAASPLVDGGHPSQSAPNDHTGNPRGGQPDIGAYEW